MQLSPAVSVGVILPLPEAHLLTSILGGIGTATGRLLLGHGAKLALLHAPFETEKAASILDENFEEKDRVNISTHACDITDFTSVERTFQAIESAPGSNPDSHMIPNMLINSAGYVSLSKMEETPPEEVKRNFNINLLGTMFTSQAFARMYLRLRQHRSNDVDIPGGRIVNLSSQAAHVALPLHGAYCASKAGLLGLTRSMAAEWGPHGISEI